MNDGDDVAAGVFDPQQLFAEMQRLHGELADIEEEERAWNRQTGHHIGRRYFQERRAELATDRERLQESIDSIRRKLGL